MSYQSNKEIKKEYARIAEIIREENFDIIAMQEVLNEGSMKSLLMPALGSKWDYRWGSPDPYYSSTNEGYAFLWRKDKFNLETYDKDPQILSQYGIGRNGNNGLIRPPYYARFSPINGGFYEIRLINTHIIHNKPKYRTEDVTEKALRKNEFDILTKKIYPKVATKGFGNSKPAYTLLLGDYNLLLGSSDYPIKEVKISRRMSLITVQNEKTTLKQSQKDCENTNDTLYSHDYDHFTFDESYFNKMMMGWSRVDALEKYYNNDLESYRVEISDHVPIKLELHLKKEGNRA